MHASENIKHPKKRKVWLIISISLIALLLIARLILPYIVLNYVNKILGNIKEYYGHVEDIDIALIRGAYVINNISLLKKDSATGKNDTIPFFKASKMDLSVQWKSLFKGRFVGEIYVENPVLNFVKGKHKNEDTRADTADFQYVIKKLMPLTINHFEIDNGQIHFRDPYSAPVIDISMKNILVKAENLSNVNDSNKILPSRLRASGDAYDGSLNLDMKLNVLEPKPTFDLNAGVKHVNMVDLNSFFKAYGKFEVEKGSFGLYTEFAAKEGAFKGYVKPIIKDLKIAKNGTFGQIAWAELVTGITEIFKNQKRDQLATEIPIEGRFDKPSKDLWTAVGYVLRNAFILALQPSVDNKIDINQVGVKPEKKTFFQKLFGKKDKQTKKE